MNVAAFLDKLLATVGSEIPRVFYALCVLVVGWIVALLISRFIESGLKRTKLDEKWAPSLVGKDKIKDLNISFWVSKIVYYFLLLFVLAGFLYLLGIHVMSEPLRAMLSRILSYLPNLFAGGVILLVAWGAATLLRIIFLKSAETLKVDEKVAGEIDLKEGQVPLSKTIGDVVYWIVFLFFLPIVLEKLRLFGLLGPIEKMWDKVFSFMPQILIAGVTLLIGWFIARVVERITSNLLAALGVDTLSEKVGIDKVFGKRKLSSIIGLIVYIIILLNMLIIALEALKVEYLTQPFIEVLRRIYNAVPAIFAAGATLVIAYIVGKIVSEMCKNLLTGVGCDEFLAKQGICKEPAQGDKTPSKIIANLVMVAIMFLAAITACEWLNFSRLAVLGQEFIIFAGNVILGVVIFVVGLYLANLASTAIIAGKGKQANLVAFVTKIVVLIFAGAVALKQVVPENDIVVWGFIIIGGAFAVAVAIAFGVGGRDLAARKLEEWHEAIQSRDQESK